VCGIFERPSTIRRYDSIADPKYDGARITRKSLMVEDDEVFSEEEEDAQSQSGSEEEEEEEDASKSNGSYDDDGDDDDDDEVPSQGEENEDEEEPKSDSGTQLTAKPSAKPEGLAETVEVLSATLRQKREEDRRKGRSVLRQIVSLFSFAMSIYIIHTNL